MRSAAIKYQDKLQNGVIFVTSDTHFSTLFLQKKRQSEFSEFCSAHDISPYNPPFTFTGKERDEETSFSYFGARYYDSDLSGLFMSVDPMADKYPSISPYAYCAWNPVRLIDPDGRIIKPTPGSSASFIKQLKIAMSYLSINGANTIINQLDNLPIVVYVSEISFNDAQKGRTRTNSSESTVYWCPNAALYTTNNIIISPTTVLNHEFDHALQGTVCPETKTQDKQTFDYQYNNMEERRVITGSEQETAVLLGEIMPWQMTRKDHYGGTCWVNSPELSEIIIPYRLTEPQTFTLKEPIIIITTKNETE